jgi:hypothetical protein
MRCIVEKLSWSGEWVLKAGPAVARFDQWGRWMSTGRPTGTEDPISHLISNFATGWRKEYGAFTRAARWSEDKRKLLVYYAEQLERRLP